MRSRRRDFRPCSHDFFRRPLLPRGSCEALSLAFVRAWQADRRSIRVCFITKPSIRSFFDSIDLLVLGVEALNALIAFGKNWVGRSRCRRDPGVSRAHRDFTCRSKYSGKVEASRQRRHARPTCGKGDRRVSVRSFPWLALARCIRRATLCWCFDAMQTCAAQGCAVRGQGTTNGKGRNDYQENAAESCRQGTVPKSLRPRRRQPKPPQKRRPPTPL